MKTWSIYRYWESRRDQVEDGWVPLYRLARVGGPYFSEKVAAEALVLIRERHPQWGDMVVREDRGQIYTLETEGALPE